MYSFLLLACSLFGVVAFVPLHIFPDAWPMDQLMNALHPAGGIVLAATVAKLCERSGTSCHAETVGVVGALALAATLELVQACVGRTASWSDLASSAAGVSVFWGFSRIRLRSGQLSVSC